MKRLILSLALVISLTFPSYAAVDFDGTDDSIISSNTDLLVKDFTIDIYLKHDAFVANTYPFAKYNATGSQREWAMFTGPDANNCKANVGTTSGSSFVACQLTADCSDSLGTTAIRHFTITRDDASCAIYIDGVSQAINDNLVDEDIPSTSEVIRIGSRGGSAGYFDGQIYSIAVWNKSLTSDEVASYVNAKSKRLALQVASSNLVGLWELDECSDGVSCDGLKFTDLSTTGLSGIGDNGANNTGLTGSAEKTKTYP